MLTVIPFSSGKQNTRSDSDQFGLCVPQTAHRSTLQCSLTLASTSSVTGTCSTPNPSTGRHRGERFLLRLSRRAGDNPTMPNRSRKKPAPRLPDPNLSAISILEKVTGETLVQKPAAPPADAGKDPAAVALGRKGGLKGGRARAAKMTKAQRSAAAKKAAAARWGKTTG